MKRFREMVLGIFRSIAIEHAGYYNLEGLKQGRGLRTRTKVVTRRTRVQGSRTFTDEIPYTGGLRINTGDALVLVDADRSGGITRLLHCWEFLTRYQRMAPTRVTLFYVFLSPPNGASDLHRSTWEFAKARAQMECGTRLQAFFAACARPHFLEPRTGLIAPILEHSEAELREQCILSSFEAVIAADPGHYPEQVSVADLEIKRGVETRPRFVQKHL